MADIEEMVSRAKVKMMDLRRLALARRVLRPEDEFEEFMAGMLVALKVCARKGDSVLESVDIFREGCEQMEVVLRYYWDQLSRAE